MRLNRQLFCDLDFLARFAVSSRSLGAREPQHSMVARRRRIFKIDEDLRQICQEIKKINVRVTYDIVLKLFSLLPGRYERKFKLLN